MGSFLYHVHRQIEDLHKQPVTGHHTKVFQHYRDRDLTTVYFNKIKKNKVDVISLKNFFIHQYKSTRIPQSRENSLGTPDVVGIVFQMSIDPTISSTLFAAITKVSYFEPDELLFSMQTVLRIGEVRQIDTNRPLYQIDLKFTFDEDHTSVCS